MLHKDKVRIMFGSHDSKDNNDCDKCNYVNDTWPPSAPHEIKQLMRLTGDHIRVWYDL